MVKGDVHSGVPHREGGMDAHGFGAVMEISSSAPLEPAAVEGLLRRMVTEVGVRCMASGARAIGHIKCYLKADRGHAKADIVRLKQGAFAEVRLEGPISRGSLVINSIILGLSEREVKRITMEALRGVFGEYGVLFRKEQQSHKDH